MKRIVGMVLPSWVILGRFASGSVPGGSKSLAVFIPPANGRVFSHSFSLLLSLSFLCPVLPSCPSFASVPRVKFEFCFSFVFFSFFSFVSFHQAHNSPHNTPPLRPPPVTLCIRLAKVRGSRWNRVRGRGNVHG